MHVARFGPSFPIFGAMHRIDYHLHDDIPSVLPEELRLAMRHQASGVAIVTAEVEGVRYGITATSLTSIALEPPVVLVAINTIRPLLSAVIASEHFAVHLLREDQQFLAERFAMPHPLDKYEGLEVHYASSGAPMLEGALASIDCAVSETLTVGSHAVIF